MEYQVVVVDRIRRETLITVDADKENDALESAKELWENGEVPGLDTEDVTNDSDPEFVSAYLA